MEDKLALQILDMVEDECYSRYTGKPGCMCGCNGNYKYTSKHQEIAGKIRGYEIRNDDLNDKAVKQMVNKFRKIIESGENVIVQFKPKRYKDKIGYFFYDSGTRYYALYFINKFEKVN